MKKKNMDEAFDWKQMSGEMSFCQVDESGEWTDIPSWSFHRNSCLWV